MIHIFTITARNYLSLAITLGDSVKKHHPEARFSICVADGLDAIKTSDIEYALVDVPAILGKTLTDDLAFKYNITEYCTSVKPILFRHFFESEQDTDLIYYMDPDTFLYDRLDVITESTPEKTLYLAPHLLDCRIADDHPYPEYKHLWEGIFNLGFCAIRRTYKSAAIIDWWDTRLRQYCYADHIDGLHTDQKWMDYAPAFFGLDLEIVRNYGVNVAHWNLGEREISSKEDCIFANDDRLIFFHFSGFDFNGKVLAKHVSAEKQNYFSNTIKQMADTYRSSVHQNGYKKFITIPYRYSSFDDGVAITSIHRRIYRTLSEKDGQKLPFEASSNFRKKIEKSRLLDFSKESLQNYNSGTVQNLGKITRVLESSLKCFLLIFGIKNYSYLIKFFSRYSRIENNIFLLKD
ncbi:hypothetical protein [Undibacterium sp. RuRC25W]|uniref:hypothetical protein n=1 Tax=Undibacterium sp. RuRC25W TaxID=3413047 RepID=UPI003BF41FF1